MSDLIERQAAIDALHTWFADGFEEDRWWNSTHVLAAIEGVPSAQQERKKDCVPWEFLERYAEWFCAMVSFPEFIREAKAFYDDTYKAESGGNII